MISNNAGFYKVSLCFLWFCFFGNPISMKLLANELSYPYKSLEKKSQELSKIAAKNLVQIWIKEKPKVSPSKTRQKTSSLFRFPKGYFQRPKGPFSGILLDKAGYVITSLYNVFDAKEIFILFFNGSKRKAKLLGFDLSKDLALLKTNGSIDFVPYPLSLPKKEPELGDFLFLYGKPYRIFQPSISIGILGAKNRWIEPFLEMNGKIDFGNNGGVVFNIYGEFVGMACRVSHDRLSSPMGQNSGIGFVLSSQSIVQILPHLKKGKKLYTLPLPSLGILFGPSKPMKSRGLEVRDVFPSTPAFRSGVQKGDFLIYLENTEIFTLTQVYQVLKKKPKAIS
ncbi:MAG: hypothetical protein D6785_13805, partial [Planctomycetota bacterium]